MVVENGSINSFLKFPIRRHLIVTDIRVLLQPTAHLTFPAVFKN